MGSWSKIVWWARFIIKFPSLFRRSYKEVNKNVKMGIEGKKLIK